MVAVSRITPLGKQSAASGPILGLQETKNKKPHRKNARRAYPACTHLGGGAVIDTFHFPFARIIITIPTECLVLGFWLIFALPGRAARPCARCNSLRVSPSFFQAGVRPSIFLAWGQALVPKNRRVDPTILARDKLLRQFSLQLPGGQPLFFSEPRSGPRFSCSGVRPRCWKSGRRPSELGFFATLHSVLGFLRLIAGQFLVVSGRTTA